jgi:hypothetical protein
MTHRNAATANTQRDRTTASPGGKPVGDAAARVRNGRPPLWLQGLLLLGSLSALGFGLWRGEAAVVLQKAVKVCLECIGIG